MTRVLIAGCGYVGNRLAEILAADGHEVWGMRRHAHDASAGVNPLVADLADPSSLDELPKALDLVVFAAGADGGDEDNYRRAYVTGPRHLMQALGNQGQSPQRLIFCSSTRVYGVSDGREIDDNTPASPTDAQGEMLLAGEQIFVEGPWPASVVRFGGIYGPGRRYFIDLVQSGRATCREAPAQYTNRIHRDDAAGMLRFLSTHDDADGTWLGVDTNPASRCEVFDWLAERLGVPRPARVAADGPGGSKRCRPTRFLVSGYHHVYPSFRDGYAAML